MDFRVLGPLEVLDESGEPLVLGGPRQRAVLACLLTAPARVFLVDSLAEAVWPGDQPNNPRRALQVSVARLRSAVGHRRIQSRGDGYVLVLAERDTLDAQTLEQAAIGTADPCSALELWRDTPFIDLADWLPAQARIARLIEAKASVALRCLDRHIEGGRFEVAVGQAEALLVDRPDDERFWIALITALTLDGRSAAAAEACRRGRQTLAAMLGLDPSPAFLKAEAQVLEQRGAAHDTAGGTAAARPKNPDGLPGLLRRFVERPFAGREAELAELRTRWDDSLQNQTQLAVIAGEPGIGKTHLAAELAAVAVEAGGLVVFGAGTPQQPALNSFAEALGPIGSKLDRLSLTNRQRSLLARVLPSLASPEPLTGDTERDRAEFTDALATALAMLADRQPIMLVIDDLHWAGRSTFRALGDIVRTRPNLPLLIVATMRNVPPDSSPELDEMVTELSRLPSAHYLALTGLDDRAVQRLLGANADAATAIALTERTAGSPLFVTQLALATDQAVDRGSALAATIIDRVTRLGHGTADVLRAAAVIGERFPLDVLLQYQAEEGVDAEAVVDALSRAEAARLLQPAVGGSQEIRFHHALVREVLYESWSATERMREHAAVAQAWGAVAAEPTGPVSGEIAWHLHHAGPFADVARCVQHARAAAAQAFEAAAAAEAAYYLSLPLALRALDERLRCELLVAKGEMEGAAGQDGMSVASSLEAAGIANSNGWDDLVVRAALSHAPTSGRWVSSVNHQGRDLVTVALTHAIDGSVERARLALREACSNCEIYTVDERRRLCDPALAELRRHGSPNDLHLGLMDAYWALQNVLRPPFDIYHELIDLGRELQSPRAMWWAAMAEHAESWYQPDLAAYGRDQARWCQFAELLGPAERYWAAISSSAGAFVAGRLEEGLRLFDAARQAADQQTMSMWEMANGPGQVWLASVVYDDPSIGARFSAEVASHLVDRQSVIGLLGYPKNRAALPRSAYEKGWARSLFNKEDLNVPSGNSSATVAGLGAIASNDQGLAQQAYQRLEPIADRMAGAPWNPLPVTHFVLGRLGEFLGHRQTARDHFEESLVLHERYGSPPLVRLSERALAE